jgi:D-glucuronyl C5-epimerase C-terminus
MIMTYYLRSDTIERALNALRYEVIDFWAEYPFEVVPEAGRKSSLHYYVYSDELSWAGMELDQHGVPQVTRRLFSRTYIPSYIAWYGLVKLQEYLRGINPQGKDIFLKQVDWLASNYAEQASGAVLWPLMFDWQEDECFLKAPWASAYAQGYAISALVRGYRITNDTHLLDLARRAADVFAKEIDEGGVRTLQDGHVMYAEYAGHPTPRILDGFLTSLLGLYDLYVETGEEEVQALFQDGVNGLRSLLPYWDYRGRWSWYGSRYYLSPRQYHTQNHKLLHCVARLCNDPMLKSIADGWDLKRLSLLNKLQIYTVYLITKNGCRIRNRTWKQRCVRLSEHTATNSCLASSRT